MITFSKTLNPKNLLKELLRRRCPIGQLSADRLRSIHHRILSIAALLANVVHADALLGVEAVAAVLPGHLLACENTQVSLKLFRNHY